MLSRFSVKYGCLTLSMLGKKKSADDILKPFLYIFSQKIGFGISCKLCSWRITCLNYQGQFYVKNKKTDHYFVVCWISQESDKD